jgi:hypothetical protein
MTKTEFLNQPVEELRAAILEVFEDEDGSLTEATKADLQKFARENWEDLEPDAQNETTDEAAEEIDPVEEILNHDGQLEITQAEGDPILVDPDPEDLSTPNPTTDLYTGRMRPNEDPTVNTDITNQPGVAEGSVQVGTITS